MPGAPTEVVAEGLHAVRNGDLDDRNRALAYSKSTPGGTVASHAREFWESFRRIQQTRRKASLGVLQNLLELLSSLAEESIAAPSPAITPIVELLKAHRNAFREVDGRFRKRLLALESELLV